MKKVISVLTLALLLGSSLTPVVFAQTNQGTTGNNTNQGTTGNNTNQGTIDNRNNPSNKIELKNPLRGGANDLYSFIKLVVDNVIIPVGGVVAVLYIMYSGFRMVIAQGNEKEIGEARKGFFWAVIGTVVLLGAWAISTGIQATIEQITRP